MGMPHAFSAEMIKVETVRRIVPAEMAFLEELVELLRGGWGNFADLLEALGDLGSVYAEDEEQTGDLLEAIKTAWGSVHDRFREETTFDIYPISMPEEIDIDEFGTKEWICFNVGNLYREEVEAAMESGLIRQYAWVEYI